MYSSLSTYTLQSEVMRFFNHKKTSLLILYVFISVLMICFSIADCVGDYGWTGPAGFNIWIVTRVLVA